MLNLHPFNKSSSTDPGRDISICWMPSMPGNWFMSWRKQLACQQGALRVDRVVIFGAIEMLLRRLHPSSMLVLLVQPLVFHWAMRHVGTLMDVYLWDEYRVQRKTRQNEEHKRDKGRGLCECLEWLFTACLSLQLNERTFGWFRCDIIWNWCQERIVYEVKDKEMTATAKGYDLITMKISSATIICEVYYTVPIL